MEAIEEPPPMNSTLECVKVDASGDSIKNADVPVETDLCHSSNGIPELNVAELKNESDSDVVAETAQDNVLDELVSNPEENNALLTAVTKAEVSENEMKNQLSVNEVLETNTPSEMKEAESTEVENVDGTTVIEEVIEESVVEVDGIVENNGEHITFETEIFIEGNHDLDEQTIQSDEPDSCNILSEIGQNIELSDALRSSDVSDTVENNNCDQEVFNKEELLDILEGNDIEQSRKMVSENFLADSKKLEEHLAMQQLSRLKGKDFRKRNRSSSKKVDRKQPKKSTSQVVQKEATDSKAETPKKDKTTYANALEKNDPKEVEDKVDELPKAKLDQQPKQEKSTVSKPTATAKRAVPSKKESIVNALVKDWSDDEHVDEDLALLEEGEALVENTKTHDEKTADEDGDQNEHNDQATENNTETSVSDETPKGENTRPQRRLTRVIKKKVIFDPDNPDTFTKTKVHIKKEKETGSEKEQSPSKKIKIDQPTIQPPKSKSPVSKMQWKKPTPKNSKQAGKRLTEVDRLLMDEGAVNMICQLTPDALKGNKNMKSKAEYIKNIQSNNPDTKEMKFRERKSKVKSEGDPKKVGSGKDRLSTSVMSPSVSEDFEAHSADDSIIYRRHSSSSYSSACMSPRRLSDVEGVGNQSVVAVSQKAPVENQEVIMEIENHNDSEIFMSSKTSTPKAREIMNKRDCLSIKEKLNSKLSQALNKRKRESIKSETPPKVKKVMQVDEVCTDVTINFNQKLAEICIRNSGSLFSIQIMKVLENILTLVDSNKNVTVTLITSECGTLCSGLDLKPILDDAKHAQEIAEHTRSLMRALEKHSKLLIIGVEGKTQGFSLALAALSDVLLVSEHATFTADPSNGVLHPGAAILNSRGLPQSLLNDLIVFGREVSATEALQSGLVSRVIWPERFQEQVRAIANDIAAQPSENITLKKQLLSLKKIGSASTFQMCLEKERDLFVKYWTSAEGRELLRANLVAA